MIGELNESTMHHYIKFIISTDKEQHEIKVKQDFGETLGIADVMLESTKEIFEIQTKHQYKLKDKISGYLRNGYKTIVVYPVVSSKTIHWIDPQSKRLEDTTKSTKKMNNSHILECMYDLKQFIGQIEFMIVNLDIIEYKYLDGFGASRKRRATKIDKVPVKINQVIRLKTVDDYRQLIKDDLKTSEIKFSSKEFSRIQHISIESARKQLNVLTLMGIVQKVDKIGNSIIYRYIE